MLYVASAMFFATEQIDSAQTQSSFQHRLRPFGSPLSKQSFANPKLVFLGAPARSRQSCVGKLTAGSGPARGPAYQPQSVQLQPINHTSTLFALCIPCQARICGHSLFPMPSGRDRDGGCPPPPAQTRTRGTTALYVVRHIICGNFASAVLNRPGDHS
jgi:hypothetical protein